MSENNENEAPRRPAVVPRPTPTGPRFGRVGDWNNNSSSSGGGGGSSGRFATLGSLGGGSGGSSSRRHESDSDDEDDKKAESWFAGGERSGLSIQGPATGGGRREEDPLLRSIIRQAQQNSEARNNAQPTSSAFSGGGYKLGDEENDSTFVPDPTAPQGDVVRRSVTIYRNGIHIEGGSFIPSGSPEAQMIANGTAPKSLFGVEQNQQIDVEIRPKMNEDYVPPAGPLAFSGAGHRLGAPVPEATSSSSEAMPGQFPSSAPAPATEPQTITTRFEVDQTLPTTSVQIRLADGTRIVSRMNLTHTVGDIRNFINASRPENRIRPYTIGTTFPNRTLNDDAATIEAENLKNSVVVQRWA
ncbi:hypothetical protein FA15DRAFT_668003 [Coprinopsis marcescibilis]|uniref:SEP-domain-containing protein n=1 Tax=Coprinopsis marcescibilis TaxID=230819 RepID=A0A5C3KZ11_COPMA|nr:hypothetical protein FA15DRAFT_668003 [Coprinopsis marcescibilis]